MVHCERCGRDITDEQQYYPLGYGPVCSGCLDAATEEIKRELTKEDES